MIALAGLALAMGRLPTLSPYTSLPLAFGGSKQPKKCLLKDCQATTTHNGGYCCADHCKKDRKKQVDGQ